MKKDLHCPFSIIDRDVICEHKLARVDKSSTVTLHNHDGYEIVLVLAGDVVFFVEAVEIKLKRGDMIFIAPYTFHGLNVTDVDKYERVVVNIRYNYLQDLSDDETDLSICFSQMFSGRPNLINLDEDTIQKFVSLADRIEKCIATRQYGQKILEKALLSEFMIMVGQYMELAASHHYESITESIISNIFEHIDQNLTGNLTVNSIADKLHYSNDYLSRVFKKTTGGSLKHYINAKKISLAQQYLHQGSSPYDVCFMVGYNNYSSFSRVFSEQIGISPKQYQLRYQGEYGKVLFN